MGTQSVTGIAETLQGVLTPITEQLNAANIVSVLGVGLGAAAGLFLLWFGIRKLIRLVSKSFTKGSISA